MAQISFRPQYTHNSPYPQLRSPIFQSQCLILHSSSPPRHRARDSPTHHAMSPDTRPSAGCAISALPPAQPTEVQPRRRVHRLFSASHKVSRGACDFPPSRSCSAHHKVSAGCAIFRHTSKVGRCAAKPRSARFFYNRLRSANGAELAATDIHKNPVTSRGARAVTVRRQPRHTFGRFKRFSYLCLLSIPP